MGAAGTMAVSSDANAAAFAYSELQVTGMNVLIDGLDAAHNGGINSLGAGTSKASTDRPDGSGFHSFAFTSKQLDVKLGGAHLQSPGDISSGTVASSGVTQNQVQVCLGDCAGNFADNQYTPVPAPSDFGSYAVSDSQMANTVLNGSADFGVIAGAKSTGGGAVASGSQLAGSTMNWNFQTNSSDDGKVFSLNWNELRHLQVTTDQLGESATATLIFTITLQKINPVNGLVQEIFNLSPSSATISTDQGAANTLVYDSTSTVDVPGVTLAGDNVNLSSDSVTLDGNSEYKLLFTFSASADAVSPVPEPGALGLLGIGLLGLGVVQYRRRRQNAAA
jgi:hypothetical protein